MSRAKPPVLYLLTALIVLSVQIEQVRARRQCAQCVSGDFLVWRSLMQDSSVGQSMGFVDQWEGTNCKTGLLNIIPCDNSCLKITIKRVNAEENAYEGMMMDCSDDLIHSSPDLPPGIDFKAYRENGVFSAVRRNFTISYSFTTEAFTDVKNIIEAHADMIVPSYKEEYKLSTILFFIFGSSFVVIICCAVAIHGCIYQTKLKEYHVQYHAAPNPKRDGNLQEQRTYLDDSEIVNCSTSIPAAPQENSVHHPVEEIEQ